jgi:hypothetical protein
VSPALNVYEDWMTAPLPDVYDGLDAILPPAAPAATMLYVAVV